MTAVRRHTVTRNAPYGAVFVLVSTLGAEALATKAARQLNRPEEDVRLSEEVRDALARALDVEPGEALRRQLDMARLSSRSMERPKTQPPRGPRAFST